MSVGDQGKGLSLVIAIGVLSLLLIDSAVCKVDPDDEEFAMVSCKLRKSFCSCLLSYSSTLTLAEPEIMRIFNIPSGQSEWYM